MKRRLIGWVLRRVGTYAAGLILHIDNRFTSGNIIPVERAFVRQEEWQTLRALLVAAAMTR